MHVISDTGLCEKSKLLGQGKENSCDICNQSHTKAADNPGTQMLGNLRVLLTALRALTSKRTTTMNKQLDIH